MDFLLELLATKRLKRKNAKSIIFSRSTRSAWHQDSAPLQRPQWPVLQVCKVRTIPNEAHNAPLPLRMAESYSEYVLNDFLSPTRTVRIISLCTLNQLPFKVHNLEVLHDVEPYLEGIHGPYMDLQFKLLKWSWIKNRRITPSRSECLKCLLWQGSPSITLQCTPAGCFRISQSITAHDGTSRHAVFNVSSKQKIKENQQTSVSLAGSQRAAE